MAAPALKRDIGLIGAGFIALNGIVGAGIFALPQTLVDGAGAWSPYLFPIFGLLFVSLAMVFAELAARFDSAGGVVVYANAAFGRFAGFQAGWLYYLAKVASIAANANALLTYLATFAPGADSGVARIALIVLIVGGMTALNVVGVKRVMGALNVVTAMKLAPLLALALWGVAENFDALPSPSRPPPLEAFGAVGLLVIYAFTAFENATLTSGETKDAKRAVPRALLAAIGCMTLLYFLIQLAYVATMRGASPEGAPLAAAARILAGPWGAAIIALTAIASIGGNLLASMLVTPRLTFAMAEERSLPRWFGAVHARYATPANSVLAYGGACLALALSGAFAQLATMSALARVFVYFLCTAALVRLRRDGPKRSAAALAVRAVAPLVAASLCVWGAAQAKPESWAFLAGFFVLGLALYVLTRWRSAPAAHI